MFSSIFQAVWSGKLLLVLVSKINLVTEFCPTHDHILFFDDCGSREIAAYLRKRGISTALSLLVNRPMHQAITTWKHDSKI
jgi:hypothetical protein